MKAVLIEEHGGPQVLKISDRPVPQVRADEVLLNIKAAGMNHLDCWVRRGVEGHEFPLPIIPGCDAAGVVEALGSDVQGFSRGDRVAIAPGFSCNQCACCSAGNQHLCRYYGIFGETTNGTNTEFPCCSGAQSIAHARAYELR